MYVLNRLWRGDISPSQKAFRKGCEYEKVLSHLTEIGEALEGEMTQEGKRLFKDFQMKQAELTDIESEEVFIEGVRLGAQLMRDAFGDYQGQFET